MSFENTGFICQLFKSCALFNFPILETLCAEESPSRIYQANWFQNRVTVVLDLVRSIQLMHIFVSDHCHLGRKKWKMFFKQLGVLLHAGQLDLLLFRTTENHMLANNAYPTSICLELKTAKFLM